MRRAAVLSLHTSPLTQPGSGDAGGMNVYIRELVSSLAQAGVECEVFVRRWADDLPPVVEVEPGFVVRHVPAGPPELAKEQLPGVVDEFTDWMTAHLLGSRPFDVLHANYWLSGVVGHRLKHAFDLPLVTTFHTLARVKATTGDPEPRRRIDAEVDVIGCSDSILANSQAEADQLVELYGADPARVEIVPPGVVHAYFSPGDRDGARAAVGLPDGPILLFVGRIQPLKGLDVAVEALAHLERPDATLVVVGGASGVEGPRERQRVEALAQRLGVASRLRFVEPQPHHTLSSYYRAADVCVVPSRSESFGLVALEAAACGVPVVASAVGGLLTLVDDGRTGLLVEGRDPADFAGAVASVLDDSGAAAEMAANAVARARTYTWASTAARLRRIYDDLSTRVPVDCTVG